MEIQLINGQFNKLDALLIITKMIDIKIKFQEDKIRLETNEEDIKRREQKIKFLQKELYNARIFIENRNETHLECDVIFN